MDDGEIDAWLVGEPALRLRVGSGGVVLGRDPACDVLLSDPRASRHHALVRRVADGVVAVALGRRALEVNDASVARAALADGDRLALPGLALRVEVRRTARRPGWVVVLPGGQRVSATRPLSLGADGDLAPPGWPARALHIVPGAELVARGAVAFARNGEPIGPGVPVALLPGDEVDVGGVAVGVAWASADLSSTIGAPEGLADEVRLVFLARGGRLAVRAGADERVCWLAERRFSLVHCLLAPPPPLAPGDDVPDEVVLPRVWPRQPHKTRVDVNNLVSRVRRDLDGAGIAPSTLARAPGGGATRFRLATGARVVA